MPYVLSPPIHPDLPPLWQEGAPYAATPIYASRPGEPPVWYQAHTLKPHSMPHMDAPAHTEDGGATVEAFFEGDRRRALYGPVVLLKLAPAKWRAIEGAGFHWEVSLEELREALRRVTGGDAPPDRLLLSAEALPTDANGQHDPAYALTLSPEAADWLVANAGFCTYGTSYKSTDFQPGRRERPIHAALFTKAALFECLDLARVPEGRYFWSAFPLRLVGASESPVCPVLFERDELAW